MHDGLGADQGRAERDLRQGDLRPADAARAGARAVYLVVKNGVFTLWDGKKPGAARSGAPVRSTRDREASGLGPFIDYTVNGLIIGNIYALLAVGLALIFGVSPI